MAQTSPFTSAVVASMRTLYPEVLADKSWDNTGLLLEAPFQPHHPRKANSVLLTIDLTQAVADEAIHGNHSVVIAYHPIIFRGLKALTLGDTQQQSLLRLAGNGISVYCPHTAVDIVPGGMADWLCDVVTGKPDVPEPPAHTAGREPRSVPNGDARASSGSLARPSGPQRTYSKPNYVPSMSNIFHPDIIPHDRSVVTPSPQASIDAANAIHRTVAPPYNTKNTGAGRVITFDEEQPLGLLVSRIAAAVGHPRAFPVAIPQGATIEDIFIKTVGLCPGSGSSVLKAAYPPPDLVFTGEVSHHDALSIIERGGSIISLFHSNSERGYLNAVMKPKLEAELSKKWKQIQGQSEKVSVVVSHIDHDPFGIVVLEQGGDLEFESPPQTPLIDRMRTPSPVNVPPAVAASKPAIAANQPDIPAAPAAAIQAVSALETPVISTSESAETKSVRIEAPDEVAKETPATTEAPAVPAAAPVATSEPQSQDAVSVAEANPGITETAREIQPAPAIDPPETTDIPVVAEEKPSNVEQTAPAEAPAPPSVPAGEQVPQPGPAAAATENTVQAADDKATNEGKPSQPVTSAQEPELAKTPAEEVAQETPKPTIADAAAEVPAQAKSATDTDTAETAKPPINEVVEPTQPTAMGSPKQTGDAANVISEEVPAPQTEKPPSQPAEGPTAAAPPVEVVKPVSDSAEPAEDMTSAKAAPPAEPASSHESVPPAEAPKPANITPVEATADPAASTQTAPTISANVEAQPTSESATTPKAEASKENVVEPEVTTPAPSKAPDAASIQAPSPAAAPEVSLPASASASTPAPAPAPAATSAAVEAAKGPSPEKKSAAQPTAIETAPAASTGASAIKEASKEPAATQPSDIAHSEVNPVTAQPPEPAAPVPVVTSEAEASAPAPASEAAAPMAAPIPEAPDAGTPASKAVPAIASAPASSPTPEAPKAEAPQATQEAV